METVKIDLLDFEVRDIMRCIDISVDKRTRLPTDLKKPSHEIITTQKEIIEQAKKSLPYFSYNAQKRNSN